MYWAWLIVVVIAIIVAIVLLNRFYRKASCEVALIRTGLGGQRIVTDDLVMTAKSYLRAGLKAFFSGCQHHVLNKHAVVQPAADFQLPVNRKHQACRSRDYLCYSLESHRL